MGAVKKNQVYLNKACNRNAALSLDRYFSQSITEKVFTFHQSIPTYQATPLQQLPAMAKRLGIAKLWIKDESHRFDLNAFKILGASYAIAKIFTQHFNCELDFNNLIKVSTTKPVLITATDGNHGRAVAFMAQQQTLKFRVGVWCRIRLLKDTKQFR